MSTRHRRHVTLATTAFVAVVVLAGPPAADAARGGRYGTCADVPDQQTLRHALVAANDKVTADNPDLPLQNDMWGTLVGADGTVCAVAHTGEDNLQSQWLASRVISAQKANTANSLSLGSGAGGVLEGLALSSANLWAAVQPGGSLFGLQFSNPVDPYTAYRGQATRFGTAGDPMVGRRIGGINVFGGGLALYAPSGERIGGAGVSGDTSCRDHMVGWELRAGLGLDYVPTGVSGDPERPDNIVFDIEEGGASAGGFGHPTCLNADAEREAATRLTAVPAR